jgi:hypothetical protein
MRGRAFHVPAVVATFVRRITPSDVLKGYDLVCARNPARGKKEMFTYQVVFEDETNSRHLGDLESDCEIQKDDCIAHGASVCRVRAIQFIGPATDNCRRLCVSETIDTDYVARLD